MRRQQREDIGPVHHTEKTTESNYLHTNEPRLSGTGIIIFNLFGCSNHLCPGHFYLVSQCSCRPRGKKKKIKIFPVTDHRAVHFILVTSVPRIATVHCLILYNSFQDRSVFTSVIFLPQLSSLSKKMCHCYSFGSNPLSCFCLVAARSLEQLFALKGSVPDTTNLP